MIHDLPPFGIIRSAAKWCYWWLKSKLFWKTIYASHRRWLQKTGLGSVWREIGEDIEYSLSLARWPEGPKKSKVAFRTKNGRRFDSITFVVEADGDKFTYDATCTISRVSDHARYTTLAGFPIYKTFASEGSIYSTYSGYKIRITQVTEDGVSRNVILETLTAHPIDQTLANPRSWTSWAGVPVNVAAIRDEQDALRTKLWGKLGYPQLGLGYRYSGVRRVLYAIGLIALSDPIIRTLFWLGISTGRIKIGAKDMGE